MEIVLKELEIADAVYESEMTNLLGIAEIEDRYMIESSGDKGENFFQKLIRVFKEFIEKTKNSIMNFFRKKKLSKVVKEVEKANRKDVEEALKSKKVSGLINTKLLKKAHKSVIKDCANLTQKIQNAKSLEELEKLEKQIDKLGTGYNITYLGTKKVDRDFFAESSNEDGYLSGNEVGEIYDEIKSLDKMDDINEINETTNAILSKLKTLQKDKTITKHERQAIKEKLKDKSNDATYELKMRKESGIRRIGAKVSHIGKKTASFLCKHKMAVAVLISADIFTRIGVSSGAKQGYKMGYQIGTQDGIKTGYKKGIDDSIDEVKKYFH